MPMMGRRPQVFLFFGVILRCNIIFAALHGIFFGRRELLHWRRLILQRLLRPLGTSCLRWTLSGVALGESGLLWRRGLLRLRRADHVRQQATHLIGADRSETRYAVGIIEIPTVLDQPNEVADLRIGGPGATKRRTREIGRHAGPEKGA